MPLMLLSGMERVPAPGPARRSRPTAIAVHQPPTFEQHHGDIDAAPPGLANATSQAVEVNRVELVQIEFRLAIQCLVRPDSRPRERRDMVDKVLAQAAIRPRVPGHRVPRPEPDEVVAVAFEEIEVRREVKRFGRIAAPHVDQIVPHVRAS